MTPAQKNQCSMIIHTAAVAAGGGNLIPVPGAGIAADTLALVPMAVALAGVFGADMTKEAARAVAFNAIKQAALKQPAKLIAKELSKFIPGLGQVVAPALSVALIEAAGWAIANELARKHAR